MRSSGWIVRAMGAVVLGSLAIGCAGADGQLDDAEPTGVAELKVVSLPAGAQCLTVSGSGGATFSINIPLTTSATVTIGKVPLATMIINASVYTQACSGISGQTAGWVADPQSVTFRAGVVTNLTLNLRANNAVNGSLNFIGNITGVAADYGGSGLLMSDGTIRIAASFNLYPATGRGQIFAQPTPAQSGVLEFAGGRDSGSIGCVRTASQLLCWGRNWTGELGTGVPLGTSVNSPTAIAGFSAAGVTQVGIGANHVCVIKDNAVQCWGANAAGQLGQGNGNTTNLSTPTPIQAATTQIPVAIALGSNFTCEIASTGTYCWGDNAFGQLGDGTTLNRGGTALNVFGLNGAVSIAAGSAHACAACADGTVRCWGNNNSGQLGDGTTTQRLTPVQVSGITDAVQVTAGANHTCARRSNGQVSCWGDGNLGQVGDAAATDRTTPATVTGVSGAVMLASGAFHNCAVQDNQIVQCWGSDANGNCGDGNFANNYKATTAIVQ